VISFLNVLDRCDKPLTLLSQIRGLLKSKDSRLLLAVPLPLNPAVEEGLGWATPAERLVKKKYCAVCSPIAWEENAVALAEEVFANLGYRVQSLSRLPYLSQGDSTVPYYSLDDAIFILNPTSDPSTPSVVNSSASSLGAVIL